MFVEVKFVTCSKGLTLVNLKLFLFLCSTLHPDKIWHTKECVCLLLKL